MAKIILKRGREESLLRFHPWVFSGAIAQVVGEVEEGDVVSVWASDGSLLACGHWQPGTIAVRVLSFGAESLSGDFWQRSLAAALEMRRTCGLAGGDGQTDCYRLVHGEGDGLPGLIIDYYNGVCVLQSHSVGMFRARKAIADALRELYGDSLRAVYDKSSSTVGRRLDVVDGYIWKAEGFTDETQVVRENGHAFYVDWTSGQKTGFFLDQRENRQLVARYSAGRDVLNLFCYTGGFSIYALAAGAVHVDSVDSSVRAMDMLSKNLSLNGFDDGKCGNHCTDAMEFLRAVPEGKYDLMVVDPPAFAKHRGAVGNALRAYQRLNASAISKVASGGLVFTFSCSQAVSREDFSLAVFSAAAQTGRRVRIVARLGQPSDHAVNIYHPEGEYLKGLLLYVE